MDDQRPTGTFALALELDALRERTHVRNPNPGSRRAYLAGAVHRDGRHLDPGTGKFVTVPVAINTERFPGEQRVEVRRPALVEKHPAHDAVGCTAFTTKVQCLPFHRTHEILVRRPFGPDISREAMQTLV